MISTKVLSEYLSTHQRRDLSNQDIVSQDEIPYYVTTLWKEYHTKEIQLAEKLKEKSFPKTGRSKIKTIAICYTRYYEGGIERVISLQIPILLQLGYKIVLFTDYIQPEKEYPLDSRVVRELLPGKYSNGRAMAFHAGLLRHNVDAVIHHTHYSDVLFFDIIIAKLLGIKVIVGRHGTILNSILENDPRVGLYHHIFQFADIVLTLSQMEAGYLETMGVNAMYFPNPIQFPNVVSNYSKNDGIILWVGRLDMIDKNYYAALEIMNEVVKTHKQAKLVIVGPAYGWNAANRVKDYIQRHHLEENIQWVGPVPDVSVWYKKAKIHLVTSAYESFSMVILESKSFGIPLVLYSLPYLELLKNGKGYISVPQFDVKAAATAIRTLLDNSTLCMELSKDAINSLQEFRSFNQTHEWNKLIISLQREAHDSPSRCHGADNIRLLFETLYTQYNPFQIHRKNL